MDGVTIERIFPAYFTPHAERILRDAWKAPCMRYTADSLAWQFGFPTQLPPIAAVAFEGNEAVGFAAVTPRRVTFRGKASEVYLLSFLAVVPTHQGRGISTRLCEAVLSGARESGAGIVTFSPSGSSRGQRCLARACHHTGWTLAPLGVYPSYGHVSWSRPWPSGLVEVESATADDLAPVLASSHGGGVIWNAPDRDRISHYGRDPRPQRCVAVRDARGRALGAARVVLAELVGAEGVSSVPIVDWLVLPEPSAEALSAIFHLAGRVFRDPSAPVATMPVVTAANLWCIDPALLRAAGVRRMATSIDGYLCLPSVDHPLHGARGTNLEVV